jgi:hypothetical protein
MHPLSRLLLLFRRAKIKEESRGEDGRRKKEEGGRAKPREAGEGEEPGFQIYSPQHRVQHAPSRLIVLQSQFVLIPGPWRLPQIHLNTSTSSYKTNPWPCALPDPREDWFAVESSVGWGGKRETFYFVGLPIQTFCGLTRKGG